MTEVMAQARARVRGQAPGHEQVAAFQRLVQQIQRRPRQA